MVHERFFIYLWIKIYHFDDIKEARESLHMKVARHFLLRSLHFDYVRFPHHHLVWLSHSNHHLYDVTFLLLYLSEWRRHEWGIVKGNMAIFIVRNFMNEANKWMRRHHRMRPIYNWKWRKNSGDILKRTILESNYDIIECLIMNEDMWCILVAMCYFNSSYMCNRLDNSSIIFLMKVKDYEIFMNERIFIEVNLIIPDGDVTYISLI